MIVAVILFLNWPLYLMTKFHTNEKTDILFNFPPLSGNRTLMPGDEVALCIIFLLSYQLNGEFCLPP